MNNTALRAEAQSANNTHMVFTNEEHERFYYEKLEQARYQDCYHKALIYILGISEDTRNHFSQIYDIKSGFIKPECLHQGWQTSGSVRVVRIAFNLYTDGTPSVDDYKRKDEQIRECREYSVSDIFCCGYAMYFWQGIQLRYPEYCQKQRSIEEILAEMERKKGTNRYYRAYVEVQKVQQTKEPDRNPSWRGQVEYTNHTEQDICSYEDHMPDRPEELYFSLLEYFEPEDEVF